MSNLLLVFLKGLAMIVIAAAVWKKLQTMRHMGKTSRCQTAEMVFSRIAVAHADDGLVVMNMQGIIQWVNPAYCRLMGREAAEMIGKHPRSFALLAKETPDQRTLRDFRFDVAAYKAAGLQEVQNQRKDGTIFWNQISTSFHTTSLGDQYVVSVCRDVTSSIAKEKQLEAKSRELAHSASHDDLTGASNRMALSQFLNDELDKARVNGTRVGVLHIDLDKFKLVNDRHGHLAGDAVLIAVAKRARRTIRETDMLARVGGDEFVIACPGLSKVSELQSIGKAVASAVNGTVTWQNSALTCQISVGAALSHPSIRSAEEMLQQSDFALYDVKQTGRGRVATYNRRLHEKFTKETECATDLQAAVKAKDIVFYFQPIVDVATGTLIGIETLARWDHPRDGLLTPADFLPIARSQGLMAEIDRQAIDAALDLKLVLNELGQNSVPVTVNASADVLSEIGFISLLTNGLRNRQLSTSDISIEILESALIDIDGQDTQILNAISALDSLGIQTALDDFGRGRAGLLQLAKWAITGIKIDNALTQSLLADPTVDKIFAALITLCRELDLRVTARGVETAEQAKRLAVLGVTILQGPWVAPAMHQESLIDWLNAGTHCPRLTPSLSKGQLIA